MLADDGSYYCPPALQFALLAERIGFMGVAIANLRDFEEKFEERKNRSDRFGFFLFDERPSQRAVATFADQQFPWLDRLAAASKMFFFVFLRNNPDWNDDVENPGLEVANMFDIRANQLPGIVLFTLDAQRDGVKKASYLPLKAELLEAEPQQVEDVLADFFSVIQGCRKKTNDSEKLLTCINKEVNGIIRGEAARPIKAYFWQVMGNLRHLPVKLIETVTTAAVTAAARQGMPLG